jgi:four helix bundle protein
MRLEDFQVYQLSMEIGEKVWDIVVTWDEFARKTIGSQLVRSVDSVAANLSEGLGRYHYKEVKHFSYYSRGSLFETQTWITKAHNRKLISDDDFNYFITEIKNIGVKMNNYISSIGNKSRFKE